MIPSLLDARHGILDSEGCGGAAGGHWGNGRDKRGD